MPVWAWVVGCLLIVILLIRSSMRSFRRGIRAQLRAWLAQHRPEWRVETETEQQLVAQVPVHGPISLPLVPLYRAVAAARGEPPEKQFEILASGAIEGAESLAHPDPAKLGLDAERLHQRALDNLRDTLPAPGRARRDRGERPADPVWR